MVQKVKIGFKDPPLRLALKSGVVRLGFVFGLARRAALPPIRPRRGAPLCFSPFSFCFIFAESSAPLSSVLSGFAYASPLRRCFFRAAWLVAAGIAFFVLIFVLLLGTKDLVFPPTG